jgi:anti-sigma B factor antagonist
MCVAESLPPAVTIRDMGLQERVMDGIALVDLTGEVSVEARRVLPESVAALLRQGVCRVVLNLANVTRLDAAGLGAILRVRKLTRAVGGDVKLVVRVAAMHQLLIRTNLWPLFEVFQSEAEAFASFEKPAA